MTKVQTWAAIVGALMLVGGLGYCSGVKRGVEDQKLADNKVAIKQNDQTTKVIAKEADSAVRKSDSLIVHRDSLRAPVKIVHDTILVPGEALVVSPRIVALIAADDSTIAAQQRSLQLQKVLIGSLRVGLDLRDKRIAILESAKRPTFGFKSGVVVGAGAVIAVLFAVHR